MFERCVHLASGRYRHKITASVSRSLAEEFVGKWFASEDATWKAGIRSMNRSDAIRLFHTLRYLKPIQVTNRIQRKLFPPKFRRVTAPGSPRKVTGRWQSVGHRSPSLVNAETIRVFQDELPLKVAADWNDPRLSHLVRYNLHYFDDLAADEAASRASWHHRLIDRWIAENPVGEGAGWEPYPLSLRIVNWIKWQLGGQTLKPHQLDSLATQTEALVEQLEFHLLANHLLANTKALIFAGCFFSGARAERWLEQGTRLMRREIEEQVLADGGHFELSPMYHSIILEDVLDVIHLAQAYPDLSNRVPELIAVAERMRAWLATMCHGDGQISFFNDAAFEIAVPPCSLEQYAKRLGLPPCPAPSEGITHLPDSGYVRLQKDGAVLIVDVAEVGPDYQPGHAHADTLSFELSVGDQRLLVNSGTSLYGVDDERKRQRSTAAHNSVEVDGKNSSDIWSGFRVGQRARPGPVHVEEKNHTLVVTGQHDGYRRLPGRVVHHRHWELATGELQVADRLEGRFDKAVAFYHLHPSLTPLPKPAADADLSWSSERRLFHLANADGAKLHPDTGTFHPRFGETLGNHGVQLLFSKPAHRLRFGWQQA